NLVLMQGEVIEILVENGEVKGVMTRTGGIYNSKAVILATGTYLRGRIFVGEVNYESGPSGYSPSNLLSESLKRLGISLRRFKTGTPARVHRDTIDFNKMEVQPGDE